MALIDAVRYVIAVMLIVAIPAAILYWLLVHPLASFWRRLGKKLSYCILCSFLIALMILIYLTRKPLLAKDFGLNWWLAAVGLALLVASGFMRKLLARELPTSVLVGVPELSSDKKGKVISTGLYAWVRHPRYLQMDLALTGYALIANYPAGYTALLLWLAGIRLVVLFEERELLDRFGDEYRAYASCVPRFIPRRQKSA